MFYRSINSLLMYKTKFTDVRRNWALEEHWTCRTQYACSVPFNLPPIINCLSLEKKCWLMKEAHKIFQNYSNHLKILEAIMLIRSQVPHRGSQKYRTPKRKYSLCRVALRVRVVQPRILKLSSCAFFSVSSLKIRN